jgi:hypothetical protein
VLVLGLDGYFVAAILFGLCDVKVLRPLGVSALPVAGYGAGWLFALDLNCDIVIEWIFKVSQRDIARWRYQFSLVFFL